MLSPEHIVATLVLDHPECARVLSKHRIDFCCRGERSIEDACRQQGVDAGELIGELQAAISAGRTGGDLRALPTSALIDYIVQRHHGYLREALPFVAAMATKVARVHGASNEQLETLETVVHELRDALEPHLDHEEQELFPALLAKNDRAKIRAQLDAMVTEHEQVGELLGRMRATADEYRIPSWACRSYRALFTELETLERDVLEHVHAENYVLRPRFAQEKAAG